MTKFSKIPTPGEEYYDHDLSVAWKVDELCIEVGLGTFVTLESEKSREIMTLQVWAKRWLDGRYERLDRNMEWHA